ncbi:hypothetical protein NPIL_296201 [Nephila pilipes]|uniref:Uncharacterized protein n=1 Tax=Nephila pilipes TaxID=299642 RepID=A0A8X6QGA6_NEPPI|nr:hypothetical protein NPIL_296201 [Nephila pilipes]
MPFLLRQTHLITSKQEGPGKKFKRRTMPLVEPVRNIAPGRRSRRCQRFKFRTVPLPVLHTLPKLQHQRSPVTRSSVSFSEDDP